MTNCGNQTGMPGINMYYFSKDENLRQRWIRFASIHRKDNFTPVKKLVFCCVHFDHIVVVDLLI